MIGFMTSTVVYEVSRIMEEERAFEKLCNSLPKGEADRLKESRRKQREEDEKHRKALEIADAGRTRNFWGN